MTRENYLKCKEFLEREHFFEVWPEEELSQRRVQLTINCAASK